MFRSASSPSLTLAQKIDSESCSLHRACLSIALPQNHCQMATVAVNSPVGTLFRTASLKSQNLDARRGPECDCEHFPSFPGMRRVHSEASLQYMGHSSPVSKLHVESSLSSFGDRGNRNEESYESDGDHAFKMKGRSKRSVSSSRLSRQSSEISKILKEIPSPLVSPNDRVFRDDGLHFLLSNGPLTDMSSRVFPLDDLRTHPVKELSPDEIQELHDNGPCGTSDDIFLSTAEGVIHDESMDEGFARPQHSGSAGYSSPYQNPSGTTVIADDRNRSDRTNTTSHGGSITGRGGGGGGKCKTKTGPPGNMDSDSTDSYYRRALDLNPAHPLLLRNYARFLYEVKGDMLRSEEFYERAILANPGDGEILAQYAKLIWELHRDLERAGSYFDQAIKASPENCYVLAAYASFLWTSESADGSSDSKSKTNEGDLHESINSCPYPSEALNPRIDPMQC